MTEFQQNLKKKMNDYVHAIYRVAKEFPRDELYGLTSQIRRASASVALNYIEGYARRRPAVKLNFFETAYGSLQESKYLVDFAFEEKYMNSNDHKQLSSIANEIGAMLWTEVIAQEKYIK